MAHLGYLWRFLAQADITQEPSFLRHSNALMMLKEVGRAFIELCLMGNSRVEK